MVLRELGHVVLVDEDQRDQVLPAVANDHRVLDVGAELQLVLDVGGRDVLAAGGDDDILFPVHDSEIAVFPRTNVPRVQPTVPIDGLGGQFMVLEVPLEHVRAPRQDFAVVRERHLDPGHRLSDRARARLLYPVDRDHPRRLRLSVALDQRHAESVVVLEQLRRRGCRAAHGDARAVEAQAPLERGEHGPAGQTVQEPEARRGPCGGELHPCVTAPHVDGCTVEGALEPGGIGHAQVHGRGEFLPDARDAGEVGRRDLAQVAEQGVEALDEVHHITDADRLEHRDQVLVDVGEGQVGDDLVLRRGGIHRHQGLRRPQDGGVGKHGALGRPGRAGGVDDHRRVLRLHALAPLRRRTWMRLGEGHSLLEEIVEKNYSLVGKPPQSLRVPYHHPLDPRLAQDRQHLVELLLVFEENQPRFRVVEQVVDLLGGGGGIDAAGHAARGLDAEMAVQPLRPVLTEHRHVLLGAEPESQESRRHPVDLVSILAPGHTVPNAIRLVTQREPIAAFRNALGEQGRESRRLRLGHHHLLFLR